MLRDTVDARFKVGQKWSYITRPDEEGSVLTIVKTEIESDSGYLIVHIYVQGLRLKTAKGYQQNLSHLPVFGTALNESVLEMVGETKELPKYQKGYDIWRQSYDSGTGGVWNWPVAKCITAGEHVWNHPDA